MLVEHRAERGPRQHLLLDLRRRARRWVGVRGKITPQIIEDLDVGGDNRAHDMASFEVDLEALALALAG